MFRSVRDAKKPIQNATVANMSASPQIRGIIDGLLDQREAKGMETYGVPFDDVEDGRDWTAEVILELLDALQYSAKKIKELNISLDFHGELLLDACNRNEELRRQREWYRELAISAGARNIELLEQLKTPFDS